MTAAGPPPSLPAHAGHDHLLVARLAGADLEGPELALAEAQVAACGECAGLLDDLRSLSRSLAHDLPSPQRQRDFRLGPAGLATEAPPGRPQARPTAPDSRPITPEPAGWLSRLVGSGLRFASPLAGGAVALGIVLLLAGGGLAGLEPRQEALYNVGAAIGGAQSAASAPSSRAELVPPAATSGGTAAAPSGAPAAGVTLPATPTLAASGASASPVPSPLLGAKGAPSTTSPVVDQRLVLPASTSAPSIDLPALVLLLGWALVVVGLTVLLGRWWLGRRRRLE